MKWIHGSAYYPELWDKSIWIKDIEYMKRLGINTVRIGEFAWSIIEPNEDQFHFEKFDDILTLLYENDISVIMCTPTATPPIWISYGHPERMYSDGGTPFSHGGRQHVCTNNPFFRERVKIVVTEIAKHFGQHPAIVAWQIDNELKCDVGECYCEECGVQWRKWLSQKYGSISELNNAWGNDVWSMTYQNFDQIPQPIRVPKLPSPSLTFNYTLFSYEKVEEFFKIQTDIIRKYSDKPITHNGSSYFGVNNNSLANLQDFTAFDSYPTADNYLGYLFELIRFRGLKPSGSFMCMETSPGFNGCTKSYAAIHPSGFLAAEATATFAFGGKGFSYWHFRQHRSGCEINHGSLITADGVPTICYPEVEKVNERINLLNDVLDGYDLPRSKIAIQYSDCSRAAMITENYHGMNYNSLLQEFSEVLIKEQYAFDIIPNDADLSHVKIVFTPFQYHLNKDYIERMKKFCEDGGVWVVGPMTDIRTEDHMVQVEGAISSDLQNVLGVKNTFLYPTLGSEAMFMLDTSCDSMRYFTLSCKTDCAEVWGRVDKAGENNATFTCRSIGKGKAIMFGAMPENREMLAKMIGCCLEAAEVEPVSTATDDIITVLLEKQDKKKVLGLDMGGKGGSFSAFGQEKKIAPYSFEIIYRG